MASTFHPVCQPGSPQPVVRHFPVDTSATFTAGALVYFDTGDQLLKECGADPSLILGVARCSVADRAINPQSLIPVDVIEPTQSWTMSSATTPADTHLMTAYGVVKTSGYWKVDTTDTSNTRLVVTGYSPRAGQQGPEHFVVKFTAANLQGDAVAS